MVVPKTMIVLTHKFVVMLMKQQEEVSVEMQTQSAVNANVRLVGVSIL